MESGLKRKVKLKIIGKILELSDAASALAAFNFKRFMKQKNFYIFLSSLFYIFILISCTRVEESARESNLKPTPNPTVAANNNTHLDQNSSLSANANLGNNYQANQANTKTTENSDEVPVYENAQTALAAGKKFFDANKDEKARQAFEQAIKLDPNLADAHFQLAATYDSLNEKEKAQKSYSQAIKIYQKQAAKNTKDTAVYYNLGRAYNKTGADEKAQKTLQQAIKLQPDDADYHYELGVVLIKLAQYPAAIKELKKAIELDPENARAEAALEKAEAGNQRVKSAKNQNRTDE